MRGLELFERDGWSLRVIERDGEPWFVAADVCRALEIANVSMAVGRLSDGVSTAEVIDSMGRTQQASVINEAGLYDLVFVSRKPEAQTFRRWVTHEVLPSIRKTGGYGRPDVSQITRRDLAQWLIEAEDRAAAAERELEAVQPMVALAENHIAADGDLSVREAAQALARDHGIDIGQNRLFTFMRQIRWIDRKSHPYQQHIDSGRLAVRLSTYNDPHTGEPKINTQVRVTPKGVLKLRELLLELAEPGELRLVQGGGA